MKNMKNYLKIIRYKNRIIINNLIENIFPTMSGQRYEIWNQLVLKGKMAKIICSSAPHIYGFLGKFREIQKNVKPLKSTYQHSLIGVFLLLNFCQFLKNNQISFQIKVPNFLVYFILSSERTKYGKRFQIYKSKRYLSI